jgi:RNA polymerase sigma factor (sigma-70 family)
MYSVNQKKLKEAMKMLQTIQAAQQGDENALNQLLTDIRPNLFRIVKSEQVPECDVDDVVQNTSLKIVQNIGTLRDQSAFRTWYGTIAYNEVPSYFRKSNNKEVLLDEAIKESVGYVPNMTRQLEKKELFQLLERLCTTEALRKGLAALKMQVLDELSLDEIAEIMGEKLGTVKSWIHRVVKHLQSKKVVFQQAGFLN